MDNSITKKNKFKNISKQLLAILYGCFVVYNLNLDFATNTGDIQKYLLNVHVKILITEFSHEYLFYSLIEKLDIIFNISPENSFKVIAFTISAILIYIFALHVQTKNYINYLWPLFWIVFMSPRVADLFASGVRSGIAFVILFYAIIYLRGITKYIIIVISALFHLSMLPIIGLYFLFIFINKTRLNLSTSVYYFFLFSYCFFLIFYVYNFHPLPSISSGINYQLLTLILGLSYILTNKELVRDLYGFLSIGTILIVLLGFLVDLSFVRYIGNSILFFLFFLINENNKKNIQRFLIIFFIYFALTLTYAILSTIR